MGDPVARYLHDYKQEPDTTKVAAPPADAVTDYMKQYGPQGDGGGDFVNQYLQQYGGPGQEPTPEGIIPVQDHELTPQLRLSDLLNRPGVSEGQKARINRLIHSQRKMVGVEEDRSYVAGIEGQQKIDELIQQGALEFTSGALHLPEMVARTMGRVAPAAGKVAENIKTFREGITPEPSPDINPTIQAAIDAYSTATGELSGGAPIFKGVSGAVGAAGAVARAAAPRLAVRAEAQLAELSARALARTGSKQLAAAIMAAPKELVAGTVFQGLLDPESLKTLPGVAMAFLFGTVGALGEGVRVSRMVQSEKAVKVAQEAQDIAAKKGQISDEQAARIAATIAETKAEKAARSAARRAWEAATPEMRRVLMPDAADEALGMNWKDLPVEAKKQVVGKLRVAASDSKLNTSPAPEAETTVSTPATEAAATTEAPSTTLPPPEPSPAPTPTPAPTPAATEVQPVGALPSETMGTVEAVRQAQELIGRDGLTREVANVLKKRGAPPSGPQAMGAIVEAVARKIVDRAAAGGEKVAPKPGEAPAEAAGPVVGTVEPPRVDDEITRLQAQLRIEQDARVQAERRANSAERASQVDNLTGLQNQNSWLKAQKRIDEDPNSIVILGDVIGLGKTNKTRGQAAGDELIRKQSEGVREALTEGDQAFRPGGDEMAIVTTPEYATNMLAKLKALAPDMRWAVGKTYGEASAEVVKIVEAERAAAPKPPQITPPSEAPRNVAEASAEPVEAPKPKKPQERTLKQIDKEIDAADKAFDEGKLTEPEYDARVSALGAEKRAMKGKAKPATEVVPRPVTRGELDYAATSTLTSRQLHLALGDHVQALQQSTDPIVRQAVLHDMNAIRREIRMREKVTELSDAALDTHANEMKALWETLPVEKRAPVESRLAEVDAEFKRRAKPDILDVPFGDERYTFPGGMLRDLDPLEAKAGTENLPAHSKRIQDRIVVDVEGDKPLPGVKDLLRTIGRGYAHVVRGTRAADVATVQLGRTGSRTIRNPGEWAELLSGSAGRAQEMLHSGPFRWDGAGEIIESGIKSYEAVLKPFKGRLNELRRFEIARYTIELLQRGKQTGVELLDAVREVNSAADDVVKAADESVAFRRGVLDYLTDAGMFSQEARAAIEKMTQAYVPLYRWLEGKEIAKAVETVGPGAGKLGDIQGPGNQVKTLVGSLQKIVDPIRSTVDQTRRFVRAADMNRLGTMLVEAAEANPELARGMIWRETRIHLPNDPSITKQAESLKAGAKAHGIALTSEVAQELAVGLNSQRLRTRSDHLWVWRNGKREVWAISPELAEMYNHFQPYQMHWLVRVMGFIPHLAKTGITDNPIFGFFNAWKDTYDAAAQSRYGFKWGVDSMTGFFNSLNDTRMRHEFRAGAGTAGGIAGRAVGSLEQSVRAILPKTPLEKSSSMILHPIDALREMSVPFEEAARLGEFARARQAGAPVMDAAIASQRVTTNFRQRGLSMEALNHIVMFLNPAIQSLDTNIRAVGRNPGKVVATLFGAVTLPSILLWAANHGNKRIEELRKSRFGSGWWFLEGNDGAIYRVPKPFTFGAIFGTGAEDALDALYDKDPTAGDRFIQTLVDQLPYNVVPTALNMTLGLIYNKDFSTGAPIAPDQLESGVGQVEPRYQARPETGPTARALGDILNVSPAKVEFAVRTSLGTLGQDVLRGIDMINNAKAVHPAPMAGEIPVIGRVLAKFPTAGAFNLRRFYDEAKKVEIVTNTATLLEKDKPERLLEYMDNHRREIALAEAYAGFRKDLSVLRSQTDYIASLPPNAMTPEEKRRLIDMTVAKMIELARDANEAIQESTKDKDFSPKFNHPAGIQK